MSDNNKYLVNRRRFLQTVGSGVAVSGITAGGASELDSDAFAYYDPDARKWTTESGPYDVFVGSSSRDIRLTESITVTGN